MNMLGVGLHSYGFMDKAFFWLMVFDASQEPVAVVKAGLSPRARALVEGELCSEAEIRSVMMDRAMDGR